MAGTATGLKQRISKALTSQKQATVTVLSSLLAVERELGYIPDEAAEEVARFTCSTVNDVWGIASFYTNFQFEPPGRHRVEVCWGPPCHILGAMKVVDEFLKGLGLTKEGNTSDGLVNLRYNTCLGACAQAPVVSVNHQLVGKMTPQKVSLLLKKINETESEESSGPR